VEAMEEAVSDSRARRIYRKGAVYSWKEEDEGSERGSEATLRVDSARISKASILHTILHCTESPGNPRRHWES
jgi:hypothetical protein